MKPYNAYREQRSLGWTRIDLLLALYDGAIEHLGKAREALLQGDEPAAISLLARAQLIVAELASGIDPQHGDLPKNLLRLYEFAAHNIKLARIENIDAALRVLNTLREGMQAIRAEAVQLERDGTIPPIDTVNMVQMMV